MKKRFQRLRFLLLRAFKAAFDDAKAAGYEGAVYVAISSGLSATCDTARMIAESITDFPIYVVDTKNIGIASGLIVIEAQRLIEQGLSLEEIGAKLDQASLNTRVYFSVPSLEYLRKGGRISEAIYRIGSMLNIKPVLTCDEKWQIHHCQEDSWLAEVSSRTDCSRSSLCSEI